MDKITLEKFIEREAEEYCNGGGHEGCFKDGCHSLAPLLLEALDFINTRRCKYYVGIVTPGKEVKVHDPKCAKCKTLASIRGKLT